MPSPRVAFDITPLQNAHRRRGIGTYVRGLAERLNAQDRVPLEFWGWEGSMPFEPGPAHRSLLLPRHPMPQHRGAWLFAQAFLRRAARRSDAPVVHVSDPHALVPLEGRVVMTTVHDLIPLAQGIPARRVLDRVGYSRYLAGLRAADTIFVNSPATADEVAAATGRPRDSIILVAPGVSLTAGVPGAPSGTLRTPSEVPQSPSEAETPYFLYVGGPDPTKNLDTLLAAMAQVQDLPERLLLVGHRTRRQRFRFDRLVARLGIAERVQHLGFVSAEDLDRLMAGATAVVIPSRREGFGLPLAEAMARGVPVVHSDIPVLLAVSGGSTLTFDPADAGDVARALRQVSADADLRRRLSAAGLARAAQLTWDDGVAATLAAYERALAGR